MRQVLKTIRGIVFLSNAPHPALADATTQFVQFLGHPWSAVAAKAQAVLIADIRQEHHVAPLAIRRSAMLPGMQAALRHPHQTAQMAAGQHALIIGNILKLHGF